MNNCKCIIATDGVAQPFILIDGKWFDLISLNFVCNKCNSKIEYSNKNNNKYPNMWDIK